MASNDVIKEYLVGMGLQDNFTDKLNKVLDDSDKKMGRFASTFGGKFALAGVAVVTATATANIAIGKFLGNLAKSDLAMDMYAKSIGKSKKEAMKLDTALKAMGRTMEEINSNAELKTNFEQLQKDAEKIHPPDMSEGLKQVREIIFEFTRLKQNATYALNWVGYYLTKYLKEPIGDIQKGFKGLNDIVIKNMPKWTDNIAKVLSWVVRLGTTLMRGSTSIYTAIKRIFDMIPRELKVIGAALAGLGLLIRAGPLGKLAIVITGLLLLLDDFYTYINGGDALLGGFWQRLIDIYETLKDSGAIDKFKQNIENALKFAAEMIIKAKDYIIELFDKFKESGSVEKFINLLGQILELAIAIGTPFFNIGKNLLIAFGGTGKIALEWFIDKGLPTMIDLLSGTIGIITSVIDKLNDFGATEVIIYGVLGAFLAFKTVASIKGVIGGITKSVKLATKSLESMTGGLDILKSSIGKATKPGAFKKLVTEIKGTSKAFVGLIKSAKGLAVAKAKDMADTAMLMGMYAKDAVVKGVSTAATWAQTAATTAWNVAAGIGATVTTAFGAAIAFLTSPIGLVILAVTALIAIVILLIKNWEKVREFFIKLWDDIKKTFSGVGEWFGDVFTNAVNVIKNVFSPLVDWFQEKVEKIKGFFGGIGDKVKGIFGKDDSGPKPDPKPGPKPEPKPVGHSSGGVFLNKHEAEIAEDGPEAVIPLTKPNRAKEILSQMKGFINLGMGQMEGDKLDAIKQSLSQIAGHLSKLKNGLNEQQNISYTSNGGNVTIQNITISPQSHNKIYGSGNPETTANAINNNTINSTGLLLRNTQGVIG